MRRFRTLLCLAVCLILCSSAGCRAESVIQILTRPTEAPSDSHTPVYIQLSATPAPTKETEEKENPNARKVFVEGSPLVTLPPLDKTETHYTLPIDFSPGKTPLEDGYLGEYEYEDPTIHVKITRGRENETTYFICDVRIADPSQLRTASADGFDSEMTMSGTKIAERMKSVVAINGDYFFYTKPRGYIVRQGHMYLNKVTGGRDVLLIDEDGDFHIVHKADRNDVREEINGKKVINGFFFGPVLVENGVLGKNFKYRDMAFEYYSQRMAISQIGKLHYRIVCCESPKRGSQGMKLEEFARFCLEKGCITAYNLDGGDSTMLYFHGEKINDVDNPNARPLADIIYFASAYDPEK